MAKDKKTSPVTDKTKSGKKRKRIAKDKEENATKIHPEQYEEFIKDVPDEEKAEQANEVKSNDKGPNENRP